MKPDEHTMMMPNELPEIVRRVQHVMQTKRVGLERADELHADQ